MVGQVLMIDGVEKRVFINVEKIRNFENEDAIGCQKRANTVRDPGKIIGMGLRAAGIKSVA